MLSRYGRLLTFTAVLISVITGAVLFASRKFIAGFFFAAVVGIGLFALHLANRDAARQAQQAQDRSRRLP